MYQHSTTHKKKTSVAVNVQHVPIVAMTMLAFGLLLTEAAVQAIVYVQKLFSCLFRGHKSLFSGLMLCLSTRLALQMLPTPCRQGA